MKLGHLLWGAGRLSRQGYWWLSLVATLVFLVLSALVANSMTAVIVVNALGLWIVGVASVQRLHDRGSSGWWLLVMLVPVLGALYLAWDLGLRRGQEGPNRFGPDPLAREADFLVVK